MNDERQSSAAAAETEQTRLDAGRPAALRELLLQRLRSFQARLDLLSERLRAHRDSAPPDRPPTAPAAPTAATPSGAPPATPRLHAGAAPRTPRLPSVQALRRPATKVVEDVDP